MVILPGISLAKWWFGGLGLKFGNIFLKTNIWKIGWLEDETCPFKLLALQERLLPLKTGLAGLRYGRCLLCPGGWVAGHLGPSALRRRRQRRKELAQGALGTCHEPGLCGGNGRWTSD